jgi:predicted nucleic acid-binding protein
MSDKTFVDTNILMYAHDVGARRKQPIAELALRELWNNQTGVLSPQVLQEFYFNATRKGIRPLLRDEARLVVASYSAWCIEISQAEIFAAFRIEDVAKISFWDALIISAALKAGATTVLSEDLNAGQSIAGVRIVNPFAGKP